jgi:hypothetical protein
MDDTSAWGDRSGWRRAGARSIRAAGAAAILACVACGADLSGPDPDTGLLIEVRKSPIVPVVREGEDDSAPVGNAEVRIRGLDRGGSLAVRTGPDGTVRVALRPGRYELEVIECPGALSLPSPQEAGVVGGRIDPALFICDTGIR